MDICFIPTVSPCGIHSDPWCMSDFFPPSWQNPSKLSLLCLRVSFVYNFSLYLCNKGSASPYLKCWGQKSFKFYSFFFHHTDSRIESIGFAGRVAVINTQNKKWSRTHNFLGVQVLKRWQTLEDFTFLVFRLWCLSCIKFKCIALQQGRPQLLKFRWTNGAQISIFDSIFSLETTISGWKTCTWMISRCLWGSNLKSQSLLWSTTMLNH